MMMVAVVIPMPTIRPMERSVPVSRTGRQRQGKEHSGRSLLENVQNIIIGKQGNMLYKGRNYAQSDKNQDNRDIQAVLQQECPSVKGIFVILPFLRPHLHKSKFRHSQHIDQMIFPDNCRMPSVH